MGGETMNKVKDIVMYVGFDFGSYVYLSVTLYEGKSIEECVKMRSDRIETYLDPDTHEWKEV